MKEFEKLNFDTNEEVAESQQPDYVNLGYWIGIRTGIKAFVNELERTAERVGDNKLPIEFIKLVSGNTIMDAELMLSKMKHGRELINAIDND